MTFPLLQTQITSSLAHFSSNLMCKRPGCAPGACNFSLKSRKTELKEEEIWANWNRPVLCHLTFGEDFSKIKPSSDILDIKFIFSPHIILMVHTPFKEGVFAFIPAYKCISHYNLRCLISSRTFCRVLTCVLPLLPYQMHPKKCSNFPLRGDEDNCQHP